MAQLMACDFQSHDQAIQLGHITAAALAQSSSLKEKKALLWTIAHAIVQGKQALDSHSHSHSAMDEVSTAVFQGAKEAHCILEDIGGAKHSLSQASRDGALPPKLLKKVKQLSRSADALRHCTPKNVGTIVSALQSHRTICLQDRAGPLVGRGRWRKKATANSGEGSSIGSLCIGVRSGANTGFGSDIGYSSGKDAGNLLADSASSHLDDALSSGTFSGNEAPPHASSQSVGAGTAMGNGNSSGCKSTLSSTSSTHIGSVEGKVGHIGSGNSGNVGNIVGTGVSNSEASSHIGSSDGDDLVGHATHIQPHEGMSAAHTPFPGNDHGAKNDISGG